MKRHKYGGFRHPPKVSDDTIACLESWHGVVSKRRAKSFKLAARLIREDAALLGGAHIFSSNCRAFIHAKSWMKKGS